MKQLKILFSSVLFFVSISVFSQDKNIIPPPPPSPPSLAPLLPATPKHLKVKSLFLRVSKEAALPKLPIVAETPKPPASPIPLNIN